MATRCKFRGRRGILCDVLKIDGSLARNIDFEVANFQVLRKTRRKNVDFEATKCENSRKSRTKCSFWCSHLSRLESLVFLWPRRVYGGSCKTCPFVMLPTVKIGGSLVWNAGFSASTCLVSSRWFSCGVAVSMGEAGKPVLFECFQAGCHVVLRGRRGTLWHSNLFDNVSKMSKLEEVSYEMLVFSASTCLVSSRWFSCGVAVSMGEAGKHVPFECFQAGCHVVLRGRRGTLWHSNLFDNVWKITNWRKSRTKCSFFCTHVSRLESLVFLWRRRVYGGSSALHTLHFTLHTPQFTL